MSKTLFTLNIGNYAPKVRALTFPLMKAYARKIGAEFCEITARKFPNFPIVYEKFQIYELGQGNDWNMYVDADALIHPEFFDPTSHLEPGEVMNANCDMAGLRFRYDRHFERDKRHIGCGNWFAVAPAVSIDLWRPLFDLTLPEALENIYPTPLEIAGEMQRSHLIDDYVTSRNVAMFGLKYKTLMTLSKEMGRPGPGVWLWHNYNVPEDEKIKQIREVLEKWGLSASTIARAVA